MEIDGQASDGCRGKEEKLGLEHGPLRRAGGELPPSETMQLYLSY